MTDANPLDLRDLATFESALSKTHTHEEIAALTAIRAQQLGLVVKDHDGIYRPVEGVDERVEPVSNDERLAAGDKHTEQFVLGNKLLTLTGTRAYLASIHAQFAEKRHRFVEVRQEVNVQTIFCGNSPQRGETQCLLHQKMRRSN